MIALVWEHVILQQEHAHAMLDVTEMTVPSLPVPMIVLVWEHVILQQEHAHAMLDVMEMTVLWFVQTTALEWELATMIQAPIQLNVIAMLDVMQMTVL